MEKKNALMELSFEFALEIIEYSELLEEKRRFVIARQVLKSGTSIGANVREAKIKKLHSSILATSKTKLSNQ